MNSRLSEQFENDYYRIDVVDGQLLLEDKRRVKPIKTGYGLKIVEIWVMNTSLWRLRMINQSMVR